MSCSSSAAGSQQPSNAALTTTISKSHSGGCSDCNSQLWSSYVVGLLACLLVVGGIFLAFHRWDYLWLAVSGVGVLLILIGASLHYCGGGGGGGGGGGTERRSAAAVGDAGTRVQKRKRGSNHHRIVCEVGNQNERLLPSAPPNGLNGSGHNFSVSQLSLNMLPPFFPAYDTVSLGTAQVPSTPSVGPAVSPIMHLNGQSFLLLPIGNATAETSPEANSLARRLSTHLAVLEQQSLSQKRCTEAVNYGLVPGLSSFTTLNTNDLQTASKPLQQQLESGLQVTLTTDKVDIEVQTTQESPEHTTIEITELETEGEAEEEPIYQVPRSPSTPVENGPQTDLNSCELSADDLPTSTSHTVPDATLEHLTVECDPAEILPLSVNSTCITVQEDELPNNTSCEETIESESNVSSRTDISNNPIPTVQVEESTSQQSDNVEQERSQMDPTVSQDSRITTPEPEWTLPPSYEEVAQPNFKRLGHLKFAYETL